MKVEFFKQFSKDLSKITDENLKHIVFDLINEFENASKLKDIPNVKKLKGYPEAYRIRIGKYRLGFYFNGETIEFVRFAKREDIYKLFP